MENADVRERLEAVIKDKINPILDEHLGGVVLTELKNGEATVRFTGNCRTCYAAEDTLDNVVKDIIFREIPEIKEVYLDNSVSEDLLDFARKLLSKE